MTLTEYTRQREKVDKFDNLSHDIAQESEWMRYLEDTIDQTKYGDWMFTITADDGRWNLTHTDPIQIRANKNDFLEFLKDYLQKAVYGNKESREYLRIRDDRELAMSVAMCVKRGDFPNRILEEINPKYQGMVGMILNKDGWEKVFSDRRAQNLGRLREIMNDQNKPLEDRVTAQQRLVYGEQYDAMRMLLYGK